MPTTGIVNRPPHQRTNFFLPTQSEVVVRRLPGVEFFCQAVRVPGVSMQPVEQHNPLTPIRHAGDVVRFDEFEMTFIVDEYLENYYSVFDWIVRLGFPVSSDQYASIKGVSRVSVNEGLASDVSVMLRDSRGRSRVELLMVDAFPISITGIDVDSRLTDTQNLTATVRWAYTRYEMNSIRKDVDV